VAVVVGIHQSDVPNLLPKAAVHAVEFMRNLGIGMCFWGFGPIGLPGTRVLASGLVTLISGVPVTPRHPNRTGVSGAPRRDVKGNVEPGRIAPGTGDTSLE